jgi:hypothetical protein
MVVASHGKSWCAHVRRPDVHRPQPGGPHVVLLLRVGRDFERLFRKEVLVLF